MRGSWDARWTMVTTMALRAPWARPGPSATRGRDSHAPAGTSLSTALSPALSPPTICPTFLYIDMSTRLACRCTAMPARVGSIDQVPAAVSLPAQDPCRYPRHLLERLTPASSPVLGHGRKHNLPCEHLDLVWSDRCGRHSHYRPPICHLCHAWSECAPSRRPQLLGTAIPMPTGRCRAVFFSPFTQREYLRPLSSVATAHKSSSLLCYARYFPHTLATHTFSTNAALTEPLAGFNRLRSATLPKEFTHTSYDGSKIAARVSLPVS